MSALPLLLILNAAAGHAQQAGVMPIGEALRDRDGDRTPDRMGHMVEVVGIVTADPHVSGRRASLTNVQDQTGGVILFSRDTVLLKHLVPGDSVHVGGTVGQHRGAEQLLVHRLERRGTSEIPAPRDVLVSDLLGERYTGRLVRVSGTLVASEGDDGRISAELQDRSGRIPVVISSRFLSDPEFTRRLLQGGYAEIVAIASQRDAEPPFDAGYHLVPRDIEDFSLPFVLPYRWIATAVLLALVLILWVLRRRSQRRADEMERLASELQRSHGALLESEARNRTMLQAIPDLVFRYTRAGAFLDFHAPDQGGPYPLSEQIVGLTVRDLFPPEVAECILARGERALESTGLEVVEYTLPLPQGRQEFEARLAPNGPDELLAVVRNVTGQREMEKRERRLLAEQVARAEAESAEKRIRNVLESISDGFVALDRMWRFVYVNTPAGTIFGQSSEDILNRNAWEVLPDSIGSRFREEYERAMVKGIAAHFEAQLSACGRWFQVHIYPGDDLLSVYYRDITARKEAERRLRESEQRFRALTENSLDTVTIVDADGTIRYNSASAVRELGWTSEELEGRNAFELIHPDDQAQVRSKLQRIAESAAHTKDVIELRFRHKNGTWRVFESLVQNRLDEPAVAGIVANSRNITERWQLEQELRTSEQRFRMLCDSAPIGIFLMDSQGRGAFANQRMAEISGISREGGMGDGWIQMIHPEDRERVVDSWVRSQHPMGPEYHETHRIVRPGGEVRWVDARATALESETGTPVGYVGTVEDITKRRQAEADVLKAKEEAERANRSKSEFLSRMSHELRTPMNAILGFAQVLEMDAETEGDRESVEQILRAGRHLLSLIDEVLDIARIEAAHMALSLEPVRVADVLEQTREMVQRMASEYRVALRLDGCERYVRADQQRLKQVLLNLLSNAVKYNSEGGSVTIGCEDRSEGRLRIAVTDTGRGIAPEKMGRLFKPFDRLDAEAEGMVEGIGLGLCLSKGLVEAMGGAVGVQSTLGEGSTFWLELPLAAPPEPEGPAFGAVEVSAVELRASGDARTVLLIEDNISNVRLIERVLAQRPGIRLLAAMQGGLGLEMARQHLPDLILLDMHLPDLRGDRVLEQLQRVPDLRDIPVVIVSADATEQQSKRLLDAGARDYLSKPFDVRRLLSTFDEVLN